MITKQWKIVIGIAAAFILGTLWLTRGAQPSPAPEPALSLMTVDAVTPTVAASPTPAATPTPVEIMVYVSGAVKNPGVYQLAETARIDDAVNAAGGVTTEADPARVNLAARLQDEQQIYVPRIDEVAPSIASAGGGSASKATDGLININSATVEELDTLPRIGPATAQRIIDYRTENGPFASIEDLQNVKGIGAATFADLKAKISVGP